MRVRRSCTPLVVCLYFLSGVLSLFARPATAFELVTQDSAQWELHPAAGVERMPQSNPDQPTNFPTRWRVFGVLPWQDTPFYSAERREHIVVKVIADIASLQSIPEQLKIGDKILRGVDLDMDGDTLDFTKLFQYDRKAGYRVYAMAEVEFEQDTEVVIGTASRWWMQWWIDGEEVLNTLISGNKTFGDNSIRKAAHCIRHKFTAGKHLLVAHVISHGYGYVLRASYATANDELNARGPKHEWTFVPEIGAIWPPSEILERSLAIRTDRCVRDETISCDFELCTHEGQFGIVFGAQDSGHYYWAYLPRWGQNWRARAVYAAIAKVDGHGHARNLVLQLMPNVPPHANAKLSMKVERRGNKIQMYLDGVRGPFVVDDSYGPGRAGVAGYNDYDVRNFQIEGTTVKGDDWKPNTGSKPAWFTPVKDTGYGYARHPYALMKFTSGEIVAGIGSWNGRLFPRPNDAPRRVNLYLSQDGGRTWSPHGDQMPMDEVPACHPWAIPWFEPEHGVIRAFEPGPAVTGQRELLEDVPPEDMFTYRDSYDKGLTWSDPKPAKLVGDWSRELYRKGCWNHIYGGTQLNNGSLLAVFLHGYHGMYDNILNAGHGTWGTEIAQPYASRSDDGGLTWQSPVPMDNAALMTGRKPDSPHGGFSESPMAQLPDGRIVVVSRPFRSPYSWQTQSDDGGKTWRAACYAPFSVAGGPQLVATRSGYLAIVGRGLGMGMHVSQDRGRNWDAGTLLNHDLWFNGYMVEAEPDVLLVFYYHPSVDGYVHEAPRMQRIRMTPQGPIPADG